LAEAQHASASFVVQYAQEGVMSDHVLRRLAHEAMSLAPSPWLRYHKGRHEIQEGIALHLQEPSGPSFNYAAVLTVAPPMDRVLALANAFFAGHKGGYGILVEGDAAHPLEAELRERGWVVFEDEPALVMPRLVIPQVQLDEQTRDHLQIFLIADEAGIADFSAVLIEAFAMSVEMQGVFRTTIEEAQDPDIAILTAYFDGKPVAAVTLLCTAGIAVLAGVATLAAYRGRGIGAAVSRAALAEGMRRGCTSAALRSGPLSEPLYRRLGFLPACRHRTYVDPSLAAAS
jgi:GNAT superfamily N-acetyltransferase